MTAFLFLEGGGFDWNTSIMLNSSVGVVMLSCVDSSLVLLAVTLWWGWGRVVVFFHHHHDLVVCWLFIIFSCQAIFSIFLIFLLLSF